VNNARPGYLPGRIAGKGRLSPAGVKSPHEANDVKTDADDQEGLDSNLDSEAEVTCPYCGEQLTLTLDPDGGLAQEYVEDCPVCCRPWRVQVSYDEEGAAEVVLEQADD